MVAPDDIRELFAYNRAVLGRYVAAVSRLSPRAATRDRGIGHLSFQHTLIHILHVHEIWLYYIERGRLDDIVDSEWAYDHYPTMKEVTAYAKKVWTEIDDLLMHLTPARLRQPMKAPWMPGRYTLADVFFQTSFEQAHHLGEMIGAFWRMNRAPPEMTWIDTHRKLGTLQRRGGGRGTSRRPKRN
ncbi:MAG: DinB family protein [Thermoplasmata archaeon]|nr:DinB family protein [Thermoplasmata archaeon]